MISRLLVLCSVFALVLAPAASAGECTLEGRFEGTRLSDVELTGVARDAGFLGEGLIVAVAVALAESHSWTRAWLRNTNCSVDRGLWQINSIHEVPEQVLFDPAGNAGVAYELSEGGADWTPWAVYSSGRYRDFLDRAWRASLAPPPSGAVVAGEHSGGLEVFRATPHGVFHRWQDRSGWSPWHRLGEPADRLALTYQPDGRFTLFALTSSAVARSTLGPHGVWSAWEPLGPGGHDLAAASPSELFVARADGVYRWPGWERVGGAATRLAVTGQELFALNGTDLHRRGPSGWERLGPGGSDLALVSPDELFVARADGVYRWPGWDQVGGAATRLAVARGPELFAMNAVDLHHRVPSGWERLGDGGDHLAVAQRGRQLIVFRVTGNTVAQRWQYPDGTWSAWENFG